MNITLKPIDENNFLDAFHLQLRDDQTQYVSHPIRSLAQAEILRDRIHAAIVDRPNRMIVRKLSLLSAFEIADLSASAPTLIPRSKSSAVFALPCIRDQKPLAANRA